MTKSFPKRLREIVENQIEPLPTPIGIGLSSGVDSNALFASAVKIHGSKNVHAFSFMMNGILSTDYRCAMYNAQKMGCKFTGIFLPRDISILERDVRHIIMNWKISNKAGVECLWPILYFAKEAKGKVPAVMIGINIDHYFGLQKSSILKHRVRDSVKKFDAYREGIYREEFVTNEKMAQVNRMGRVFATEGIEISAPFRSKEIHDLFKGTSWDELNKPKEKYPMRLAWRPEFSELAIRKHSNYQLGNTGIADHFTNLLNTPICPKGAKSVVAIYNAIKRGEV